MSTYDEWNRLSARIRGLVAASDLFASLFQRNEDALGALVNLGKVAHSVTGAVNTLGAGLDTSEIVVKERIRLVVEHIWTLISPATGTASASTPDMRRICIQSAIVALASLESEVSYLLFDRQGTIRHRTERAFEHLQRSIVVDATVRQRWEDAFESGEIECEKLGAVHLLGHGIWAFKVDAAGGRTDLVYQEPIRDLERVIRSSDGLVLTEWKRQSHGQKTGSRFADARKQAKNYASGVLAGAELTRVRYLVLVSEEDVDAPADVQDGTITYRHINVAIKPRTPSKR